jgi:hypothetical protein
LIARRPSDAVEHYRSVVQRTLSCVTDHVLSVRAPGGGNPYGSGKFSRALILADGQFVPLRSPDQLKIRVLLRFELVNVAASGSGWTARTREYSYTLATEDQLDVAELIAYHWQPDVRSGVRIPHLHLGSAISGTSWQLGTRTVNRIHFPTGIVTLTSIIRVAIEELGAEPLRTDWQTVLDDESNV